MFDDPGHQFAAIAVGFCTNRHHFGKTQAMKLVGGSIVRGAVRLINDAEHRFIDFPQTLNHFSIQRDDTGLVIDQEENQVRLFNSNLYLIFNFVRQFVDILDPNAARIDKFKAGIFFFDDSHQPIARNAGLVIDDSDSFAHQPIKETGLPNIGAADNNDFREVHR